MEDKIINTIYELKRDVNVCKEMIERVQHHNKENIKLSFETENWKHIFRQKNEIELSKYLLIKILEKIEELKENGYWNYLEKRDLETTIDILQELLESEE